MQSSPISSLTASPTVTANASVKDAATNAFGLSFESLLKIILTQLTFQDPLKPMDNFQFVSQLAQFSQLQIGQTGNDRIQSLVTLQASASATSLLGKTVDVPAGTTTLTGKVVAVSLANGTARITLKTTTNQTIGNISVDSISQVRETN